LVLGRIILVVVVFVLGQSNSDSVSVASSSQTDQQISQKAKLKQWLGVRFFQKLIIGTTVLGSR